MSNIEDKDIITDVLDGDTNKFSVLIDKYKLVVFKIVSAHIPLDHVEEVANDVFFKSFKSLKNFKFESPFVNWLTVITVRTCKDYWRSHYSRNEVVFSSFDEEIESSIMDLNVDDKTPENTLLNSESYELLLSLMDSLKPVERTVVNMMYAEERSIKEISELTGLTESNVKVIAFRSRKKLANLMNKYI